MKLYRYISLQAFCELIYNKQLTFKQPKMWPDQYEGYSYKLLDSPEGKDHINEILNKRISESKHRQNAQNMLRLLGDSLYCVCFSLNKNEEVMWNAYGYHNQTIMIEVEEDKLNFANAPALYILPVEYDLEEHGLAFLTSNLFEYDSGIVIENATDSMKHKRKCFSYEKEVRVIIQDIEHSNEEQRRYDIEDISSLVTGVMVHPLATPEYVKMINTLCDTFSLKFLGKSNIYDLNTVY